MNKLKIYIFNFLRNQEKKFGLHKILLCCFKHGALGRKKHYALCIKRNDFCTKCTMFKATYKYSTQSKLLLLVSKKV